MTEETKDQENPTPEPQVFGWVAGKPAYLQEHPDNKNKKDQK
jgi:hypothetical protein